jgi:hypothetical protein
MFRFHAPALASAGTVAVILALAGLTGCGGASPGASVSAATSGSVQAQARAVWLQYAACARSHGYPDFPDPQVDSQGRASFPPSDQVKQEGQQIRGTCGPILNHLPAAAQGRTPVTPALLREERQFAACLRHHGLPYWPDPRPDGTFPLTGTPYANEGKSTRMLAAIQACRQYDPGTIAASSS